MARVEFAWVVGGGGDEASDIVSRSSYVGEATIAYRSTKAGLDLIYKPKKLQYATVLAQVEFVTVVVGGGEEASDIIPHSSYVEFNSVVVGGGEEASDIIPHSSYVGEDTIAYRSTKVEFVTVVVGGGEEASDIIAHSSYVGEDTIAYRSTKVGLDLICEPIDSPRKTKLFCTMGPACWSEEGIAKLLEAGMNVARFNFSHGDHASHQEVLDRLRKVAAEKKAHVAVLLDTKGPEVAAEKKAHVAVLLDTKGPEVRTAMLRDHQPIELEAGQELTVVAAGEEYTSWEGYKDSDTGETKIGLSYALLCADMKPGMRILIGDGTLILEVMEILSAKELKAKSLNSHKLGERKNCNLPGVKIQLPVLTAKDVQDVEQFACKNRMDFIAASFVQTAEDVRFIRKTLDHAGGKRVGIIARSESAGPEFISKIERCAMVDETSRRSLREGADGLIVARGELAMAIPPLKGCVAQKMLITKADIAGNIVALAQKMLITKANIAGKFIVCATQMLESMIENPLPTRAEMTDTANGKFSYEAAATMAAIVANAEVGVNNYQKPMTTSEAVLGCACMNAIDVGASMILVVTSSGIAARLVAKYRPPVPVLVVTNNVATMRQCLPVFSLHPYFVADLPSSRTDIEFDMMIETAILFAMEKCLPVFSLHPYSVANLPSSRTDTDSRTVIELDMMIETAILVAMEKDVLDYSVKPRKTKIVCTMGPACWSEEGMTKLLDAGMNVARFNFSHGDHAGHQEVLDRLRKYKLGMLCIIPPVSQHVVLTMWLNLLDTKGPEVRTAMVRDGKEINLEAGQEVTLVAVGEDYTTWEGFKDESTGETKIGISYAKLCQSVQPGYRILISDGTLVIQVLEILSDTELRGKCLNSKKLGPRKNCNLPGVKVDIPVLTSKDVEDLQHFCVKNKMDFVAASFVQTGDDVKFIRKILDDAGGVNVKIISKIENAAGLEHYDAILKESDGIMVARGDLAMEIPSEKVALAQKMLITKANIAGKFVITATQMLESIRITANAENTNSYVATQCFIRDHSKKPFSRGEAFGALATSTMVECDAQLIIVISTDGFAARMASKYRPNVPMIVVTTADHVANQCSASFGAYAIRVPNYPSILECIEVAKAFALSERLWQNSGIGYPDLPPSTLACHPVPRPATQHPGLPPSTLACHTVPRPATQHPGLQPSTLACHTVPRPATQHPGLPPSTLACHPVPRPATQHPGLPPSTQTCHLAPWPATQHPGLPPSTLACNPAPRPATQHPGLPPSTLASHPAPRPATQHPGLPPSTLACHLVPWPATQHPGLPPSTLACHPIPRLATHHPGLPHSTLACPFVAMEFVLKKKRAGCTGMFWRPDPTGKISQASNDNWPRDDATLRGEVIEVNGEKWLAAKQIKQAKGEWVDAPVGAFMPFEYDNHYYLE
eukprot:gene1363-32726_t